MSRVLFIFNNELLLELKIVGVEVQLRVENAAIVKTRRNQIVTDDNSLVKTFVWQRISLFVGKFKDEVLKFEIGQIHFCKLNDISSIKNATTLQSVDLISVSRQS